MRSERECRCFEKVSLSSNDRADLYSSSPNFELSKLVFSCDGHWEARTGSGARRRRECFSDDDSNFVYGLLEESVDGAQMIVVVFGFLLRLA